jgi:DNA-binding NtrC family response regulator
MTTSSTAEKATQSHRSGAPAPAKEGAPPSARKKRLLLAEDDAELRRSLAWALRKAGYDVAEFADGIDLVDELIGLMIDDPQLESTDAIVSDIRMPGVSGLSILDALRSFDTATPVILITAFGDPSTHVAATLRGARVLDKPFDAEDLLAAVRRALETRRPRS